MSVAAFLVLFSFLTFLNVSSAYAGCGCTGCVGGDVPAAQNYIRTMHRKHEKQLADHIIEQFQLHRENFLLDSFFKGPFLQGMMQMQQQLSTALMKQTQDIGMLYDAKNKLEAETVTQSMEVSARKDYQTSEDFCWFGTNVRSLAHSENISRFNIMALSQRAMARHLRKNGTNASGGAEDKEGRWRQFRSSYCEPKDNNWTGTGTGLEQACGKDGASNKAQRNIDVNYTRLIEIPSTLKADLTDDEIAEGSSEENVITLDNYLYGHDVIREVDNLRDPAYQKNYMALRSVTAKRSVAQYSHHSIVGLKLSGSSGPGTSSDTWRYLGAVLKGLGVSEAEIPKIIGERPSYYAQLEILAKKIYQNPDFYANLYDTPANVQRKSAALKAIELMLDRAIYESQLRQEMLISVMLASKIEPRFKKVNRNLN